jgi:hypothetical protein
VVEGQGIGGYLGRAPSVNPIQASNEAFSSASGDHLVKDAPVPSLDARMLEKPAFVQHPMETWKLVIGHGDDQMVFEMVADVVRREEGALPPAS